MTSKMLLLAGEGILPVLVQRKACQTFKVVTVSCQLLRFHPNLHPEYLLGHFSLGALLDILEREKPFAVCCAGKVPKACIFSPEAMDEPALGFFASCQSLADREIVWRFLELFKERGIEVLSPVTFLRDWITEEGVLFGPPPTEEEWRDISYGQRIARFLADEEIGQTVVVKRGTVVALEGAEGTDETIRRGLALARGGIVVKVARTCQNPFIDIPAIGMETVRLLGEGGGKVIALESQKTLLVDREEIGALSRRFGVTVVGISP